MGDAAVVMKAGNSKAKPVQAKVENQQAPVRKRTLSAPVRVYSDRGEGARLLGVLDEGDAVEVMSTDGDFSQVSSASGFSGWMFGKFLDVSGGRGTVTGGTVRVRAKPATTEDATIIGQVTKNNQVKVLDERNGWYRIVITPGKRGWVRDLDRATSQVVPQS